MSDIEQENAMTGEQMQELAALEAMAQSQAVPGAPQQEQQEEAPPVPLAQEIAGGLLMVANLAAPMFPTLQAIYTQETCQQVGVALEPVCIKHGWLVDGIGGKYKEELLALAVVLPLAFATYKGIQADIEASKKKESTQVENVALPLGQHPGVTNSEATKEAVTIGKVIPHENS